MRSSLCNEGPTTKNGGVHCEGPLWYKIAQLCCAICLASFGTMPFDLITGKFIPEKSNIWRDSCDGFLDWVREHVYDGAPLNSADLCGDPPMLLAAGNGHLAVVKLLLEEGARVDQRNVQGETPLIRAAHNGQFYVVEHLLNAGADVNALDLSDNTALHWAAMRGHVEIVRLLLGRGADTSAVNKLGRVPVDNCQPQWSDAYRFTQQAFAAHKQ